MIVELKINTFTHKDLNKNHTKEQAMVEEQRTWPNTACQNGRLPSRRRSSELLIAGIHIELLTLNQVLFFSFLTLYLLSDMKLEVEAIESHGRRTIDLWQEFQLTEKNKSNEVLAKG